MSTCMLNILTLFLGLAIFFLSIPLATFISEVFQSLKKMPMEILVPVGATVLFIFLFRFEMPKHIEVTQCGQSITKVACR